MTLPLVLYLLLGVFVNADGDGFKCFNMPANTWGGVRKGCSTLSLGAKKCRMKRCITTTSKRGNARCKKFLCEEVPVWDRKKPCEDGEKVKWKLDGYEACPQSCGDDPKWTFGEGKKCGRLNSVKKCKETIGNDGRLGIMACAETCADARDCGLKQKKPHLMIILADDLGTAAVGYLRDMYKDHDWDTEERSKFGKAETHTPNIDRLANAGVKLARHYSFRICSPSRCSLQSGRLAVHVNTVNTGLGAYNEEDPFGGAAGVPRNMTCMAEVLKGAGYRTHAIGKWDVGMATPTHTPHGRGYDTWTGFYLHANKYWNKKLQIDAVGELDSCLNELTDFTEYGPMYSGPMRSKRLLTDDCKGSTEQDPVCYKEHAFKLRAKQIIKRHPIDEPMFMFYSFGLVHTPLEVPLWHLNKVAQLLKEEGLEDHDTFDLQNRARYAAMTYYMDEAIGEIEKALKDKGMWDDTLIMFVTDNGGPIYSPGSGNNYPLKGGKYSDWEGGVRVASFLSGGFVPKELEGKTYEGVVSIADWYATFAELAGVDPKDLVEDPKVTLANEAIDTDPALKNVPKLHHPDSRAVWQNILEDTNPRADNFHLSPTALMKYPYKFVMGRQPYTHHTGPMFPTCADMEDVSRTGPLFEDMKVLDVHCPMSLNETENDRLLMASLECEDGCLYNIVDDPTEQNELSGTSKEMMDMMEEMKKDLEALNVGNYAPERGEISMEMCTVGLGQGGFYGPFVDIEGFYSPLNPQPEVDPEILDVYKFVDDHRDAFIGMYKFMILYITKFHGWDNFELCEGDDIPPALTDDQIDEFIRATYEMCDTEGLEDCEDVMDIFGPIMHEQLPVLFGNYDF